MDFQKLLLKIGQALGQDELKALAFLCTDLLCRNPKKVETFSNLFSCLMDQDHLSADQPQLLSELLLTIQQPRLLRDLGLSDQECGASNVISPYRKLLYELSEDITADDLGTIKFMLNKMVPRRKLEENTTTLEVFLEMERLDLINDSNLNKLEDILNLVCPVLNVKIDQYKAKWGASRPRSLSFPSESNQGTRPFVRTGSYKKAGEPPLSLPEQSLVNSSNSSDDVGQAGSGHEPVSFVPNSSGIKDALKRIPSQESTPSTETQKEIKDLGIYPMTAAKRGVCVILNNNNFSKSQVSLKERVGTQYDEESLRVVFGWLGFDVVVHRDCDKNKMLFVLRELSRNNHSQMDCLVCCVLSHGSEGSVYGVDGRKVQIEELMDPFDGLNCPSLVEKPKLFFIQACQGTKEQRPIDVDGTEEDSDVCSDSRVTESIPSRADFLLGMATVPSYVSFREREKGTWYIQSLCQNLTQMVPWEIDLISILTKVNADVSRKSDRFGQKKQMPQPAFSLRKKVVFPIPKAPPPSI